jgi:PAS domain S-box-containing protein
MTDDGSPSNRPPDAPVPHEADASPPGESLPDAQAKYRALLRQSPDSIVLIDAATGDILEFNDRACEALGYSREEFARLKVPDFEASQTATEVWQYTRRLENTGRLSFETRHRAKDGRLLDVSVSCSMLRAHDRPYVLAVWTDVTKQKRAEARSRASNIRFRTVVENLPDGVFAHDLDGRLRMVNKAACRQTGYTREELLTLTVADIDAKSVDRDDRSRFWLSLQPGASAQVSVTHRRKDGSTYPAEVHLNRLDLDDQPIVLAIARDVAERTRSEAALQESQRRLATLMSNLPGMVYRCRNDPDWTMQFVSDGCLPLTGYAPQDLIQSHRVAYAELIHPDDRSMVWESIQDALKEKRGFESVYRIITAAGEEKWVSELGRGLFDGDDGSVLEGFITDITERKRAEQALRDSRGRLQALFEAAPVGIGTVVDRVLTSVNSRFCNMLGYSEEELLGKSARIIYPSEEAFQAVGREKYSQIARFGVGSVETQFLHRDGHVIDVLLSSAALVPGDLSAEVVFTALDITDRKRAERLMTEATRAAEAANRAKTEFLANMSHEIRTPMTAVLGYADLLAATNLSQRERHDFLRLIRSNGEALLTLISDILDLSKIEAGWTELQPEPCDPVALVQAVISTLHVRAEEKGLHLSLQTSSAVPRSIRSDPARVRQILTNLIGNAVKFTSEGEVRTEISSLSETEGKVQLAFAVHDTGIGIEPDMMRSIFEPFAQADSSHTRQYGGTGLGLAISRRLAEMLGGTIEAESTPDQGSTFRFVVDVERAGPRGSAQTKSSDQASQRRGESPVPHAPGLHGRILLAEDIPDVQRLMIVSLEASGLEVDLAEDGRQACEMAMRSEGEGRPYDVILMDIQMPVMDGYEATRRLRARGWKGTIIALTAHALKRDRQASLAAGCDDYLAKPLSLEQLRDRLAKYLAVGSAGDD